MAIFNVRALYAYKFLSQCLPIYAFYTILFIKQGQSVTEVAVLIALWSVFTIVFEVPSGMIADRWNRRNMLVIAAVLQGLCFVIWYFSDTFVLFALGFVFWAFAAAFTSGTEEGLIYDNLKYDGCEESFTSVYGKSRFYANIGCIVGIVSAGFMINYVSIESIALISAAICFINVIFVLQLREKNFYQERLDDVSVSFLDTLKEACFFLKESKTALVSVIFLVLFASLSDYLNEFDALIINDFRLNEVWVSVILAVRFIFVALGDVLAEKVQLKITSIRQVFLFYVLSCICLLVFAAVWNQSVIWVMGLSVLVMAIVEILLVNTVQREIKEEGRATVMSFYSAGQNAVMICFCLVYAVLAEWCSLQLVYIIIAVYGMIGGMAVYLFYLYSREI